MMDSVEKYAHDWQVQEINACHMITDHKTCERPPGKSDNTFSKASNRVGGV